jgi:hypothetical protein
MSPVPTSTTGAAATGAGDGVVVAGVTGVDAEGEDPSVDGEVDVAVFATFDGALGELLPHDHDSAVATSTQTQATA